MKITSVMLFAVTSTCFALPTNELSQKASIFPIPQYINTETDVGSPFLQPITLINQGKPPLAPEEPLKPLHEIEAMLHREALLQCKNFDFENQSSLG